MFTQDQIKVAVNNAITGKMWADFNYRDGWSHSSNSVVFSSHRDYLFVSTDGWKNTNERIVVIKNMRGMAILSLI